jgi:hypothetical protein
VSHASRRQLVSLMLWQSFKKSYIRNTFLYMRLAIIIAIFLCSIAAKAQDSTAIYVPAGKSFSDVAFVSKAYKFPNFKNGNVYFKDGSIIPAKLNYSFLSGQVEFINPKGDTLAIEEKQEALVKYIVIDTTTFYYDIGGYLEELAGNETGKVLKRELYCIKNTEKIGAYGQASSISSIGTYSSFAFESGSMMQKLTVRENLTLTRATEYFIGDQYNRFLHASKKNLLRLFSKKKTQIDEYLQQNNVDFENGDHLQKLLAYLQVARPGN